MYKKTTTTVEEYFDMPQQPMPPSPMPPPVQTQMRMPAKSQFDRPVIRIDVPLMIRLLEYAKEEAANDVMLHEMVERMVELCEYGEVLDMDEYYDIINMPEPIIPAPPGEPPLPPKPALGNEGVRE